MRKTVILLGQQNEKWDILLGNNYSNCSYIGDLHLLVQRENGKIAFVSDRDAFENLCNERRWTDQTRLTNKSYLWWWTFMVSRRLKIFDVKSRCNMRHDVNGMRMELTKSVSLTISAEDMPLHGLQMESKIAFESNRDGEL